MWSIQISSNPLSMFRDLTDFRRWQSMEHSFDGIAIAQFIESFPVHGVLEHIDFVDVFLSRFRWLHPQYLRRSGWRWPPISRSHRMRSRPLFQLKSVWVVEALLIAPFPQIVFLSVIHLVRRRLICIVVLRVNVHPIRRPIPFGPHHVHKLEIESFVILHVERVVTPQSARRILPSLSVFVLRPLPFHPLILLSPSVIIIQNTSTFHPPF